MILTDVRITWITSMGASLWLKIHVSVHFMPGSDLSEKNTEDTFPVILINFMIYSSDILIKMLNEF